MIEIVNQHCNHNETLLYVVTTPQEVEISIKASKLEKVVVMHKAEQIQKDRLFSPC